ncbi:MAG TPA: peptide deformylase [Solirubrobacteraceae bacterium]
MAVAEEEPPDPAVDERDPAAEEPEAPPPLDPEVAARRKLALSYVRKLGDPILKTKARPVDRFDDALRVEVRDMRQLMHDALGIGLAAPQVGISHRLLVYRVEPDSPTVALVNPEIEWSSREEEIGEEGCLSLPHVHVEVERPLGVLVRARDEHGDELVIEATGLEARVIQHEIDHLDGVLILDRTTREQRKAAMRAMREAEQAARAAS